MIFCLFVCMQEVDDTGWSLQARPRKVFCKLGVCPLSAAAVRVQGEALSDLRKPSPASCQRLPHFERSCFLPRGPCLYPGCEAAGRAARGAAGRLADSVQQRQGFCKRRLTPVERRVSKGPGRELWVPWLPQPCLARNAAAVARQLVFSFGWSRNQRVGMRVATPLDPPAFTPRYEHALFSPLMKTWPAWGECWGVVCVCQDRIWLQSPWERHEYTFYLYGSNRMAWHWQLSQEGIYHNVLYFSC